ncbi:MAG: flagellar basal body P-ring formation chaperone FlgA [Thermoguttaceae bacterium]
MIGKTKIVLGLVLGVSFVMATGAAEIRFRGDVVVPRGNVITLGEIAEVVGEGSEKLGCQIVCPAPAAGETLRFDRVALRNMLSYLVAGTTPHTLTGSDVVTIAATNTVPAEPQRLPQQIAGVPAAKPLTVATPTSSQVASIPIRVPQATPQSPSSQSKPVTMASYFTSEPPKKRLDQVYLPPQRVRELEAAIAQSISDYLNECIAAGSAKPVTPYPWVVTLKLEPLIAKRIDTAGGVAAISGGKNPVVGPQSLELTMQNGETLVLAVSVSLPTEAVVVQRAIPRGKKIAAEDVALVALENPQGDNFIQRLDDVVGMEATSQIREGTPVTPAMLAAPMLVRKNETVTVYSRAAGITIKTYGKSKDDAPQGGLVSVERQDRQRDTFYARVVGQGTVEVTGDAAKVAARD